MAGQDFLESFFDLAKKKFKSEDMDELFRAARAASGGKGKKKKQREKEEAEKSVEKALIERPLNSKGFGADSTLAIVQEQGKFSKEAARYVEPARNSYSTCGACRLYLRDENSEMGRCQAVEGDIAWYGTSDYFLSAADEADYSFEASHPQIVEAYKEDIEIKKKIEERDGKYVVLDSTGKKVLGTHDSKASAVKQLQAIEASKKSDDNWEVDVDFYKQDVEKQLVFGVVMEPDAEDTQGDFSNEEEIEKAAHLFLRKSRIIGKSHKLKAKAEVVESYIAREAATIDGQEVKKGSWVMVTKIHDKELWEGIKSGEFTGFSIAGKATKIEGQLFGEEESESE